MGDLGGDHHPPRTLNSAMLAPNPHTGAHPGHTKRCFDAILMIFANFSRFFQELATESPYWVHNQAILRGFIRIHTHPSTSIQSSSNHPPVIHLIEHLSKIYRPILLQTFSNPPPILLQPSSDPPPSLQSSPNAPATLPKSSKIFRKSIENISNLYRKVYRTSIENLSIVRRSFPDHLYNYISDRHRMTKIDLD